jgi:hypothetical protein
MHRASAKTSQTWISAKFEPQYLRNLLCLAPSNSNSIGAIAPRSTKTDAVSGTAECNQFASNGGHVMTAQGGVKMPWIWSDCTPVLVNGELARVGMRIFGFPIPVSSHILELSQSRVTPRIRHFCCKNCKVHHYSSSSSFAASQDYCSNRNQIS